MHLVIVVSLPESIEVGAQRLSDIQQVSVYEARTRLAGDLPRIVGVHADPNEAHNAMRALIDNGFLAAVLEAGAIEHDRDRDIVQTLAWGDDEVEFVLHGDRTRVIRYDAIDRIIVGARTATVTTTTEKTVKRFDAGRTLLTGGLVTRKASTTKETRTDESREAFAYVSVPGERTVALYERRMHYGFLGAARQASSFANFRGTVADLAGRAPGARLDERLLKPIGLGTSPLPPPGIDPGAWKSDVAVALRGLRM